MIEYTIMDPMTGKPYRYVVRDEKENRLYQALQMALKDECPSDHKDYVCQADETEEQRCEECILRWATKDFSKS